MPLSRLDAIYRKILLSKFFTKGWGDPDQLAKLLAHRKLVSSRESCFELVSEDHSVVITKEQKWSDYWMLDGKFRSPFAMLLPEVVPTEVQDAYFQLIIPLKWKSTRHKPVCIHLAGTGDHFFWRRRNFMAKPLLKADLGALLLENPFYGLRKPKDQIRSSLHNVSDIFVMGGCLILESLVLLHWCEKQGFGPLGLSGLSMGGHMASLAATNWPKPVVLVPCLSWSTASSVFTEGVMSNAIDWDLLEDQYVSNKVYDETLLPMAKIVDEVDLDECVRIANGKRIFSTDKKILKSGFDLPFEKGDKGLRKRLEDFSPTVSTRGDPRLKRKACRFMRAIMDECTHLKNFSRPVDASLIIVVCAEVDGYVPRAGCTSLADIWPGAEVRYVDAGHVGAYILHQNTFRTAIIDAFDRAKQKTAPTSNG